MNHTCVSCSANFTVTPDDVALLDRISPVFGDKKMILPPPTHCPACRQQKCTAWRNERSIYLRACGMCTKNFLSIFHPDQPYNAICPACFWSDSWNPLETGKEFDFTRTFSEQFSELLKITPLLGLININTENSEYCSRAYGGRNNYLSFILLFESENILYSYYTMHCKDCTDCCVIQESQLCYEVVDGENCYRCAYSTRIRNCNDSLFLEDCIGCTSCYQCKNLHQKSYCIQNKQYSKEEYEKYLSQCDLQSAQGVAMQKDIAETFFLTLPNRAVVQINCENVTGANITNCRNSYQIFDFYESENMRYCTFGEKAHDCMDCYGFGTSEFCYCSNNMMGGNKNTFCVDTSYSSDCLYCYSCNTNASQLFGCVSVKKKSYCILNKQYTKEEYEELVPKIIEHMQKAGEWGEGFSIDIAPWAYNETEAQQYFPLDETQAAARGWKWRGKDLKEHLPPTASVPDTLSEASHELTKERFACSHCNKKL